MENVLQIDLETRAAEGSLTFLLLNQPPRCDSRCRRCFMPAERRGRVASALSAEEQVALVKGAAALGVKCLEISGEGEPLLSAALQQVVGAAFASGITTTVITNGHFLSGDTIRFFRDHDVTLVVSLLSADRALYEYDNGCPGSFDTLMRNVDIAAAEYRDTVERVGDRAEVYRLGVHSTVQSDNLAGMEAMRLFCDERRMFFSAAPVASVGSAVDHPELRCDALSASTATSALVDNSIILSRSSAGRFGREVCGTCLYGLNIGFDGCLLFDAHSGYEIGARLGNVRTEGLEALVRRQLEVVPAMFRAIRGFCPVRDDGWAAFVKGFLDEGRLEVCLASSSAEGRPQS